MSVRRFGLAAAIALAVVVTIAFAAPVVTVVLTNGQAFTGTLVAQNDSNNIIVVGFNGQRMSWPRTNVAVISFTPGQPSSEELQQVSSLPGNQTLLRRFLSTPNAVAVLQDGQIVSGRLAAISNGGSQIALITSNNQRNNYFASDLARLYLNPSAAENALAMNRQSQPGAVGTTGALGQVGTITVPANRQWTHTGVYVRSGDQLVFRASGQIRWNPQASSMVGPPGGSFTSPNYPVPNAGAGALIGRVANGQPFLVPSNGQAVTMPADGELALGINDDTVSDNSGSFQVQVARAGGH